ncbi:hypothetical protein K439DRAFT_1657987 [Ramaria rubella]|nr:hypothetical protein K439DRAFT_1657987 [Ramaria rubella]
MSNVTLSHYDLHGMHAQSHDAYKITQTAQQLYCIPIFYRVPIDIFLVSSSLTKVRVSVHPNFVSGNIDEHRQSPLFKHYLCAAMAMLVYDHIITFSDEVMDFAIPALKIILNRLQVEHIWKRMRSVVSVLFLIVKASFSTPVSTPNLMCPAPWQNRYYTLMCMTVVMISFFSPSRSREVCLRFIAFERWGIAVPLVAVPGTLLILRVHALYDRNICVLIYLSTLLAGTIAIGIWEVSYPGGRSMRLMNQEIDAFRGCAFLPSLRLSVFSLSASYSICEFKLMQRAIGGSIPWCQLDLRSFSFRAHHVAYPALVVVYQWPGVISEDLPRWRTLFFRDLILCVYLALHGYICTVSDQMDERTVRPTFCLIATMINRLTINIRIDPERDFRDHTDPPDSPTPPKPRTNTRLWSLFNNFHLMFSVQEDAIAMIPRNSAREEEVGSERRED